MKCGTHHDGILSVSPVNSSWLEIIMPLSFFLFFARFILRGRCWRDLYIALFGLSASLRGFILEEPCRPAFRYNYVSSSTYSML